MIVSKKETTHEKETFRNFLSFPLVPSCLSGNSRKKERVPVTDKHSRWNRSRKRRKRKVSGIFFSFFQFVKAWGPNERMNGENSTTRRSLFLFLMALEEPFIKERERSVLWERSCVPKTGQSLSTYNMACRPIFHYVESDCPHLWTLNFSHPEGDHW